MDALANYGSDDDSSSSSQEKEETVNWLTPKNEPTTSFSALLEAYSDDDDDDSDNGVVGPGIISKNNVKPSTKSKEVENSELSNPPSTKKARLEVVNDDHPDASSRLGLPPPPLGSSSSMIHWDVDYLEVPVPRPTCHTEKDSDDDTKSGLEIPPVSASLAGKLEHIAATTSHTTWADHLKSQREFHNPHFFQSVVEHFGIQQALGSQMRSSSTALVQDYELKALGIPKSSVRQETTT
jgi:hypothetical protein